MVKLLPCKIPVWATIRINFLRKRVMMNKSGVSMKKFIAGFTFLELMIALVIIAVIAIAAIPKIIHQTSNARLAELNGLVGAINSDVMLSLEQFHASTKPDHPKVTQIVVDEHTISIMPETGYPAANEMGIAAILPVLTGYSVTYNGDTAMFNFRKPIADCNVIYNDTTGQATVNDSGC